MADETKKLSTTLRKVKNRRERGLCGACGKDPCDCYRGRRKQKYASRQTPDLPKKWRKRKKLELADSTARAISEFRKRIT